MSLSKNGRKNDDHFQLEAHKCLHNKKKATCKRITGFQFLPQDPSKLMVTCSDAKVRIISGTNVVRSIRVIEALRTNFLHLLPPTENILSPQVKTQTYKCGTTTTA